MQNSPSLEYKLTFGDMRYMSHAKETMVLRYIGRSILNKNGSNIQRVGMVLLESEAVL
jgi:hypothetical protein